MDEKISSTIASFEPIPPNPDAIKMINRVLDQNDRILAMNADLLKVASCYSMMIAGTRLVDVPPC